MAQADLTSRLYMNLATEIEVQFSQRGHGQVVFVG